LSANTRPVVIGVSRLSAIQRPFYLEGSRNVIFPFAAPSILDGPEQSAGRPPLAVTGDFGVNHSSIDTVTLKPCKVITLFPNTV
jgi:hypothetical protein